MKYIKTYENIKDKYPMDGLPPQEFSFDQYDNQVIIKDSFLANVGAYIDKNDARKIKQITTDEIWWNAFKGKIATRTRENETLSILSFNFNGITIDFDFPTYQLVNAKNYEKWKINYEMWLDAKKYNL